MYQLISMPSPTGKNSNRLYMRADTPAGRAVSAEMAYDTALVEESEDNQGESPKLNPARLMGWLKKLAKMSPQAWADLQRDLCDEGAEDDTPEERLEKEINRGNPDAARNASGEPPPFPGRPRTGGAMDSRASARAAASFADMYPGASDIRLGGGGYNERIGAEAEHERIRRQSSASSSSFDAMYPAAANIKLNGGR